ncbi:MAG TPA: VCBS repeat-containing protein [Vicinamibacteria bacterium]|nr:VCBS repeat-containing protein [Vicinamibacteria bacterium]
MKARPAILALAAVACSVSRAQQKAAPPPPPPAPAILGLDGQPDARPDAGLVDVVRKECAACHVAPSPSDAPRAIWKQRLQDMKRFSLVRIGLAPGAESALATLDLEPFFAYFEARAPETLPVPEPWPALEAGRFERRLLSPPGAVPVPILASTQFLDLDGDGKDEIVACDLGHGLVLVGDQARRPGELREIAKVANPARASMADLDQDGRQDLLIADVGYFLPEDHEKGTVTWLRQTAPGQFEKRVLAERLPRPMDVEAADFDGDGDLDLVVAAFGLHTRGGTLLLENQTTDWKEPRFEARTLDERAGAIHVPTADLDGDGRIDFVALLAQQHEAAVAFLNRGRGEFEMRTLFAARTPAWGSTGIDLTDFDADGDLDVLMTNGATLDDATVKPWHGVRWLENRGAYPFDTHDLAALAGAHRARSADLDGDGDLDVAAAAFLPDPEHTRGSFASLVWLERRPDGSFVRHTLQAGQLSHTTLDLADYDGDGDVDIVTGNFVGFTFARMNPGFRADGWVELWENRPPTGGVVD